MSKINPDEDGITHINVYSKGKTELGQLLSNFAYTPFVHSEYGKFNSIEAFWYYYFTGCKHDDLKLLYGYKAKEKGRKYNNDRINNGKITDKDKEIIIGAI